MSSTPVIQGSDASRTLFSAVCLGSAPERATSPTPLPVCHTTLAAGSLADADCPLPTLLRIELHMCRYLAKPKAYLPLLVALSALALESTGANTQEPPPLRQQYDVVIRNGRVFDGMGNPWRLVDLAFQGDRIAAVGDLSEAMGRTDIDADGLFVAPGFIDTHTHAGSGLVTPELSHAQPLLAQGLTMVLVNPDGRSPLDLAAQRESLLRDGLGVNVGQMVGHGSLRQEVIGMEDRLASPEELDEMKRLLRAGLEEGAWGFSAGPFYTPGSYSDTNEHVELGKVAADFDVPYQSHIRDESDYTVGVIDAVEEVITVAREAGIPGVVTHVKVLGPNVWGFSKAIVHRLEKARAEGVEVWADQYPYPASATGLSAALLPRWSQVGGSDSLQARFEQPGHNGSDPHRDG